MKHSSGKSGPGKSGIVAVLALCVAGCSSAGPSAGPSSVPSAGEGAGAQDAPTLDASTRSTPVVVGRPSRVFVFAGVGKSCEPIAAPEVTVTSSPLKGDISFQPGQETAIMSSAKGTCIGSKATGTGVYYTARAGTSGTKDRFSVTARLDSGETATRTFEVRITE